MFLYQTKINGKDGLVFASEDQDKGKQIPIIGEEVFVLHEQDGVMTDAIMALDEDGNEIVAPEIDVTTFTLYLNGAGHTVNLIEECGVSVYPETSTLTFESANTSIATVDNAGMVTAVAVNGSTTITMTATNGGIKSYCPFTVEIVTK